MAGRGRNRVCGLEKGEKHLNWVDPKDVCFIPSGFESLWNRFLESFPFFASNLVPRTNVPRDKAASA